MSTANVSLLIETLEHINSFILVQILLSVVLIIFTFFLTKKINNFIMMFNDSSKYLIEQNYILTEIKFKLMEDDLDKILINSVMSQINEKKVDVENIRSGANRRPRTDIEKQAASEKRRQWWAEKRAIKQQETSSKQP